MRHETVPETRPVATRIGVTLLWFIPVYLITRILVGALIGVFAGFSATTFEQGLVEGQAAALTFFENYGPVLLALQTALTAWLGIAGILPGTGREKKAGHGDPTP